MTSRAEGRDSRLPPEAEVVVVGGGIAGASTAYHAAAAGLKVVLVERRRVGGETTAAAAGILSPPMRQPFHETVRFRGADTARLIWSLAAGSIRGLTELLRSGGWEEEAQLDSSGGLVLAESHTHHEVTDAFEALREAELDVEWLTREKVRALTGGRGFTGGYRIRPGGSLNPVVAARALVEAGRDRDLTVAEGVEVQDVERDGAGFRCRTSDGTIRARAVVYANHVGARSFSPFLAEEIVPIRGQALLTEPVDSRFSGSYSTHWKLNVWRQTPDGCLVLSGWRHDAWSRSYRETTPAVDEELQEAFRHWFQHAFPGLGELRVRRRWSGIFGWTADYLPLVGPLGDGEYVVAGFSGGGLPFAFEAGRIIAAELKDEDPLPGTTLLSPARFARFQQER